jgi:hypothetical protein
MTRLFSICHALPTKTASKEDTRLAVRLTSRKTLAACPIGTIELAFRFITRRFRPPSDDVKFGGKTATHPRGTAESLFLHWYSHQPLPI